jgi:hypothetical protein
MLVSSNAVAIFAQGLDQLVERPVEFPGTVALKWSSRINEETRAGSHDPAYLINEGG